MAVDDVLLIGSEVDVGRGGTSLSRAVGMIDVNVDDLEVGGDPPVPAYVERGKAPLLQLPSTRFAQGQPIADGASVRTEPRASVRRHLRSRLERTSGRTRHFHGMVVRDLEHRWIPVIDRACCRHSPRRTRVRHVHPAIRIVTELSEHHVSSVFVEEDVGSGKPEWMKLILHHL